jgi:hypothetical protein
MSTPWARIPVGRARTPKHSPSPPRGVSPSHLNNKIKINFIKEYINHAKNLQKISNLNKNNLKFHIERNNKYGAKLSLQNNRGENQAFIIVQPEPKRNNKISLNLAYGRSHVKRKGYGLFLRSLANKIGRNLGTIATTQLAVNINKMGGDVAPSSHLLKRMGANVTWRSNKSSSMAHLLHPLKSRTTKILAKRYGVRPPNLPRKFDKILLNSVKYANLPSNARSLENSHTIILNKISNKGLKEALDPLRRRVRQKMISPKNLFGWYVTILRHRTHARHERVQQLEKRKARTAMRRPKGRTLVNYSNL